MPLAPGARLGVYEVLGPLGAGAMGEVFRARDTKLGREVALKLLPEGLGSSPERLSRLEREARTLASLHHPHVATLFAFEEHDSRRFLVMELVPGETLAERIARGPLPLREALALFRQIAEGLEAAHEKGVVHRDLKPANIKITPDGRAKVLDFGLAKNVEPTSDPISSALPTESHTATSAGAVVGTAAYMSPEQARGLPVDKRTDVWAFGACLFEALSGKRPFAGATLTDTLAQVLEREPDWDALPKDVPPLVRRLLRRCLKKNPAERLRDVADARLELGDVTAEVPGEGAVATGAAVPVGVASRPPWRHPLTAGLAVLTLALGGALVWSRRHAPRPAAASAPVVRFTITLPPDQQIEAWGRAIAVSPDGRELVYGVVEDRGQPGPVGDVMTLHRRRLDDLEARPIPGTEFAYLPFFSPDGEWVGFQNARDWRLMKVSLRGGAPQAVSSVPGEGAVWTESGTIVYATDHTLLRVPESGGVPEALMTREQLASAQGELFFRSAQRLPGTTALLVGVEGFDPDHSTISVLSGRTRRTLLTGGALVAYLATGHILYSRPTQGSQLFDDWHDALVVPFDLSSLRVTGKPVPVLEGVRLGQVAVSEAGTLAYASGATGGFTQQLTWTTRDGTTTPVDARLPAQKGNYLSPRLSPDGRRLLYSYGQTQGAAQIFVRDLVTGETRIVAGGPSWWCAWTPDGQRIVYIHLNPEGTAGNLYWKAADGMGAEERLTSASRHQQPLFVTPDGRFVAYQEESPETGFDLWLLPLEGDHAPRPLLQTKANERLGSLSPDGRFLAYVSDQTGRDEVWVRPFPDGQGAVQVSNDGETDPLWAPDGRTLFYRNLAGNRLFAAAVGRDPALSFGVPTSTAGWWSGGIPYGRNYDVTPDGRRLIVVSVSETAGNEVTVVVNWLEELRRKLAEREN
jgi:eukaryotic-like serine/threonine-protein kinase